MGSGLGSADFPVDHLTVSGGSVRALSAETAAFFATHHGVATRDDLLAPRASPPGRIRYLHRVRRARSPGVRAIYGLRRRRRTLEQVDGPRVRHRPRRGGGPRDRRRHLEAAGPRRRHARPPHGRRPAPPGHPGRGDPRLPPHRRGRHRRARRRHPPHQPAAHRVRPELDTVGRAPRIGDRAGPARGPRHPADAVRHRASAPAAGPERLGPVRAGAREPAGVAQAGRLRTSSCGSSGRCSPPGCRAPSVRPPSGCEDGDGRAPGLLLAPSSARRWRSTTSPGTAGSSIHLRQVARPPASTGRRPRHTRHRRRGRTTPRWRDRRPPRRSVSRNPRYSRRNLRQFAENACAHTWLARPAQ